MANYDNKERLDFKIWKTILDILIEENLQLKNSLLKDFQSPLNNTDLGKAEQLQSRLLHMDDSLLQANNKVKHYIRKNNLVYPIQPGMRLQSRRRYKKMQIMIDEVKDSFISLKMDVAQFKQSVHSH